ncbi:MAG: hypothetical protein HOW73_02845 [Polyangiaceae bacterium]|nr:hypothetical protein [Polyangiaceae bacterium]
MKKLGIWVIGTAVALGIGLASPAPSAWAQGKGGAPAKGAPKKDEKKPAAAAEAPTAKTPITIQPKELAWGIDKKKLASVYDKVIDGDFAQKYRKAQPGPEMDRLDAEVAEKKAEFRRSEIKFESVPTGMDQTPLRPEYTYNNKEFLLSSDRGGKTRYFFFINDKMYKVVDSIKLGEKSDWGKTFDEAVGKLNTYYGANGRVRAADEAAGRPYKEVDWKDATSQVRAVDWDDGTFGIIFQDSATVAQLPSLRKNKDTASKEVDAKVKDAGRKKEPEPAPPPNKGKAPPPKAKK